MFMTKREKWLIYGLMILATLVTVVPFIWMIIVDSIGQRNSYVKTWGCGGFLNETNIYSRGKSLCF